MRLIPRGNFNGTDADLQARVAAFRQAVEDHKLTVGVPAPREDDLIEHLARSNEPFALEPEPPKPAEVPIEMRLSLAVQAHLDATASALGYDSIFTAVTYAEEPAVPKFQQEGKALRAWRSLVWGACEQILADVKAGKRAAPTQEALIAELPAAPVMA